MVNFERDILPLKGDMERSAMRFTDYDSVQDIVQKTLIKLWNNIDKIEKKNLKRLVYVMIKNEALNSLRIGENSRRIGEEEDFADLSSDDVGFGIIIDSLNDHDGKIIKLYYLEKLTFREIGEELGFSTDSIKHRHNKIIKNIKDDV